MRTLSLMAGLCLGASAWANLPANEPVEPIAPAEITDPAKVELGKQLFFDPRLSRSGFIFHRKVKTTGFQPVSFSATMRGWRASAWITDTAVIRSTRSSITLFG